MIFKSIADCLWIGTCGILYKLLSAGLQQFFLLLCGCNGCSGKPGNGTQYRNFSKSPCSVYAKLGHPCADGIRFAALIGNDVSVGRKRETFAFMGAIYIIFWYNSHSSILLLCTGLYYQRQSVCACRQSPVL